MLPGSMSADLLPTVVGHPAELEGSSMANLNASLLPPSLFPQAFPARIRDRRDDGHGPRFRCPDPRPLLPLPAPPGQHGLASLQRRGRGAGGPGGGRGHAPGAHCQCHLLQPGWGAVPPLRAAGGPRAAEGAQDGPAEHRVPAALSGAPGEQPGHACPASPSYPCRAGPSPGPGVGAGSAAPGSQGGEQELEEADGHPAAPPASWPQQLLQGAWQKGAERIPCGMLFAASRCWLIASMETAKSLSAQGLPFLGYMQGQGGESCMGCRRGGWKGLAGEILRDLCVLGDILCQGYLDILQPTEGFLEAPGFGGGFGCYPPTEVFPAFQQKACQQCLCNHIFPVTKSTHLLTPGDQKIPKPGGSGSCPQTLLSLPAWPEQTLLRAAPRCCFAYAGLLGKVLPPAFS